MSLTLGHHQKGERWGRETSGGVVWSRAIRGLVPVVAYGHKSVLLISRVVIPFENGFWASGTRVERDVILSQRALSASPLPLGASCRPEVSG